MFSKDNIRFRTQNVDSELKWDIYSELWESNDFYYLIQGPRLYTLIPKRAFINLALNQAFEEIVLSNLKSPKRKL
ncbi:MAG: YcxB family protein [Clostridiales bacterium]|nr:YcxB family protein [Clostridiales bacterium]